MDNSINDNIEKSEFDARDFRRKETKLEVYDWLKDLPEAQTENDLVEVRFKNNRKNLYRLCFFNIKRMKRIYVFVYWYI